MTPESILLCNMLSWPEHFLFLISLISSLTDLSLFHSLVLLLVSKTRTLPSVLFFSSSLSSLAPKFKITTLLLRWRWTDILFNPSMIIAYPLFYPQISNLQHILPYLFFSWCLLSHQENFPMLSHLLFSISLVASFSISWCFLHSSDF